ncbi:MAG: FAD-binding oxidoreductase [Thermoproteota archaeon]
MSQVEWDVVIIGAGLMGLSSAYYIKKHNLNKSVLVLEREKTYAQGNSGMSVAGFRDMFSTEINFKLAKSSIKFYRHVQHDLNYDIGMKYVGYLFLMSSRKFSSMEPTIRKLQKSTKIDVINIENLKKISEFNFELKKEEQVVLSLEPIEIGVLGKNCGILDIEKLASFYYEQCKSLGVEFKFGTEVKDLIISPTETIGYPGEPFLWQNKVVSKVVTENHEFSSNAFVITAGAWTGKLLDPIGVDSHMKPKKRYVYQIGGGRIRDIVHNSFGLNEESVFPFTILPSHGVYVRPHPQNSTFWVSTSGTTSDQEIGKTFSYDSIDNIEFTQPPKEYFAYNILPVLRAYFKDLGDLRITGSWTGYYSLNTQDKTPYIFKFLNSVVATGGSGAGLMKADSIGRIVSSVLVDNKTTKLFDGSRVTNKDLGVIDRNVGIESLRF